MQTHVANQCSKHRDENHRTRSNLAKQCSKQIDSNSPSATSKDALMNTTNDRDILQPNITTIPKYFYKTIAQNHNWKHTKLQQFSQNNFYENEYSNKITRALQREAEAYLWFFTLHTKESTTKSSNHQQKVKIIPNVIFNAKNKRNTSKQYPLSCLIL